MTKQIFIGLYTEGTTDERFLHSVVRKAFDEVAFEATGDFDFYIEILQIKKLGLSFIQQALQASKEGVDKFGISFLCLHKDADDITDQRAFSTSINPAIAEIQKQGNDYCKVVVAIVPVRMTEAWLLADKDLFKKHLGTILSDHDLDITQDPENIANPKRKIESAIRIAMKSRTKRRPKQLTISDLYMPLGDQIETKHLEKLSSYRKFKASVRNAFIALNYLHV